MNSGGTPANGSFDFVFTAYDSSVIGSRVAGAVTNSNVSVIAGLFSAAFDFGTNVFTGGERWLEVAVRTNGSSAISPLLPRQALTAAPYAIYAGNVNTAGIAGTIPGSNIGAGIIRFCPAQ